jgi:hexokinase
MTINNFLKAYQLRTVDIDINDLINVFTKEMDLGLAGHPSSLRMIPTYIAAENEVLKDTPVLAIDAGGTNFRAALITFGSDGVVHSSDVARYSMPGIDQEISADQFFATIARYVELLVKKTDRIGFCFSYPTEILPDGDGRLLQFCKEVQAPGVVGQLIGKRLLETLGTPSKKIVLLNDTVATLLAGKSVTHGEDYASYIGFILGTGTNACYIEENRNIRKIPTLDQSATQIINIESGNFGKTPRSNLDELFDATTTDPGKYRFEKMISGGYFGGLCLIILRAAASEGIFSKATAERIGALSILTSREVNDFLEGRSSKLNMVFPNQNEAEATRRIFDCLIDRSACLAAAHIAAVVLKTGKGKHPESPVLITIEGTTFYKLKNLQKRLGEYMSQYLDGERKRYVKFAQVNNSSLLGAALAGLID